MPEYSFTLMIDGEVEAKLDDLFEVGCDDATFGSVDGVHYASFGREAETLGERPSLPPQRASNPWAASASANRTATPGSTPAHKPCEA